MANQTAGERSDFLTGTSMSVSSKMDVTTVRGYEQLHREYVLKASGNIMTSFIALKSIYPNIEALAQVEKITKILTLSANNLWRNADVLMKKKDDAIKPK